MSRDETRSVLEQILTESDDSDDSLPPLIPLKKEPT